jgi:hypothetical protein
MRDASLPQVGALCGGGEIGQLHAAVCWPEGMPFVFSYYGMQLLQQPDKITFLYPFDRQFRQVRMNQPHPARVTPSWYGDSVGHYEGDQLVIDTVGIKIGRFSMFDWFRHALH